MPNVIVSPNMGLPVPQVGVDPGPDWASNLDACLSQIDAHNHTTGKGVQIPVAGLNINADFPLNGNNLVLVRSTIFIPQGAPLSGPGDIGSIYVSGQDLYYNDVSGNQVRITQGGSVAGTPGSISGLTPPASASYQVFNSTFVFQSAVNTGANMDIASLIIRPMTAGANGITISAPAGLPSDYTVTMPATLPASPNLGALTATSSGAMLWVNDYDAVVGSSAQVTAGLATHSTIAAAQAAVGADGIIKVLRGTFVGSITVSQRQQILGMGVATNITGGLSFVGVDKAFVSGLNLSGNVSFDAASTENMLIDSYVTNSFVFTDNGSGNYVQLTQG